MTRNTDHHPIHPFNTTLVEPKPVARLLHDGRKHCSAQDSREPLGAPYTQVRCVTDVTIGASCMGDPTGPAADAVSLDRYTALVAALLGVRIDYASARFDAEVAAALAANRVDVETARTLRWWQRASVREVEGYAGSVLPAVLATRSDADTVAAVDSDESAQSWQQATTIKPSPAPSTRLSTPLSTPQPANTASTVVLPEVVAPMEPPRPSRVITIPDLAARRRSAKEIQQAVREALRATAAPFDAGPPFDAPGPQDASSPGRDRGDHAHSAPTA
jgi:hypothetical protein